MILITGASGHIGRRTADLVARRRVPLRLMTRTPQNAPNLPGVEIVRGDFAEPDTLEAAFRGVNIALVISGSSRPGERALLHRNAFEAAARCGVQHVVYLSLQGSGPHSKFAFSRDHYTSEQFLANAGLPSFTILRNAFYMDMLPGFVGQDETLHDPAGAGRAAFVSREDAARTAAAAIMSPPGGIREVTGPEAMGIAEGIERLAHLTHRRIRYEYDRAGTTQSREAAVAAEGWRADLYNGWFEAIAAGELDRVTTVVERLTGAAPMTLEAYFSAFPKALGALRASQKG